MLLAAATAETHSYRLAYISFTTGEQEQHHLHTAPPSTLIQVCHANEGTYIFVTHLPGNRLAAARVFFQGSCESFCEMHVYGNYHKISLWCHSLSDGMSLKGSFSPRRVNLQGTGQLHNHGGNLSKVLGYSLLHLSSPESDTSGERSTPDAQFQPPNRLSKMLLWNICLADLNSSFQGGSSCSKGGYEPLGFFFYEIHFLSCELNESGNSSHLKSALPSFNCTWHWNMPKLGIFCCNQVKYDANMLGCTSKDVKKQKIDILFLFWRQATELNEFSSLMSPVIRCLLIGPGTRLKIGGCPVNEEAGKFRKNPSVVFNLDPNLA
ncbi:hypothetical protein VP01_2014g1 [Puccinia sorghi]|uniref:Uncharacterized protein n=1 Tax=Puccinia sorghi TaxID=27349 RepID=A0A0L6VB96_9BASI|nr:hypothetical protein VP01_2014g1 [Puccinia sorghi]